MILMAYTRFSRTHRPRCAVCVRRPMRIGARTKRRSVERHRATANPLGNHTIQIVCMRPCCVVLCCAVTSTDIGRMNGTISANQIRNSQTHTLPHTSHHNLIVTFENDVEIAYYYYYYCRINGVCGFARFN